MPLPLSIPSATSNAVWDFALGLTLKMLKNYVTRKRLGEVKTRGEGKRTLLLLTLHCHCEFDWSF